MQNLRLVNKQISSLSLSLSLCVCVCVCVCVCEITMYILPKPVYMLIIHDSINHLEQILLKNNILAVIITIIIIRIVSYPGNKHIFRNSQNEIQLIIWEYC